MLFQTNRHDGTLPHSDQMHTLRLLRTHKSARALTIWLLIILTTCGVAMFLPWRQNIRGKGKITALSPADRPQTVNSVIGGRIESWYVQEGQFVQAGDTLVKVSEIKQEYFNDDILDRMQDQITANSQSRDALTQKVLSLEQQALSLSEGMDLSVKKAQNKLQMARLKVASDSADMVAARVDYEIAQRQFQRQQTLYDQGLKSLTDLEKRKLKLQETKAKVVSAENKLGSTRNELLSAQIELSSIRAEYDAKIAKTRAEQNATRSYIEEISAKQAGLKNKYAGTEVRRSQYYLTAPQDGFVVHALRQGIGEIVKEGEAIATVMPDAPSLAAELYVKANDVPLLTRGRKVRLIFDGWPSLQVSGWPSVSVGTFGGKIQVIDLISNEQGLYRILVVPDPEEDPWPEQLRIGSGTHGWAILDRVPVWFEVWRQLNGFPPALKENPANPEYKKTDSFSKK